MPLANGEVFAGFQILRPLGFGGMGEVYLVAHPRLSRGCHNCSGLTNAVGLRDVHLPVAA